MQRQLEQLEKEYGIEWRDFKIGDLFDILTTKKKFNAADVAFGGKYRYIARGDSNNGIRGYITEDTQYLNEANTISFGQDTATMFYQSEAYFTGDKIKIFRPKKHVRLNINTAQLFISTMKKAFSSFSWGSSSYNVSVLNATKIQLPTTTQKGTPQIAFDFMERFIATLEAERLATLEAYLTATGLKDYTLTNEEQTALDNLEAVKWGEFSIISLFSVKNTHCILSRDIVANSGCIPYLTAGQTNNSVGTYINFDNSQIDEGNCVFIGGKTFVVTYQENDFFSNDSHNLALYHKDSDKRTKNNQLFMLTSIYKSLSPLYSWGDSISNKKIQKDKITLPVRSDKTPDYDYMNLVISAMQKVVIKDVVLYADKKLVASKQIVDVKQTVLN